MKIASSEWRDREAFLAHMFARLVSLYVSPQFARFILFGGSAAIVNLAVGSLLYSRHAELPYWVAIFWGALSGLVVNFGLNYLLNLKFRGRSAWQQFRTFLAVAGTGVILTSLIAVAVLAALSSLHVARLRLLFGFTASAQFAAQVISVGMVTFYSYAAHKYFTFNVGIRKRLWG